jgi:predicted extracellular nuclease
VVVGDFEGPSPALRGFYLQDLAGDSDPATSDGIFVFNGDTDSVTLGDVVRVTGSAEEFQNQTQISSVSSILPCGVGSVTPVDVSLPFSAADYPERYEGMLVRLPQTLYVTEHFQLGRFGQAVLTSRPDRLQQPTNVTTPGAAALALQAANNLDRIILDDQTNSQNPDPIAFGRGALPLSASNTLRGGDSAAGIVGVLTYTWSGNAASGNAYRLRPIGALNGGAINFAAANPRPASPTVGGRLRVTAANLLNYFNSFGNGNCQLGVGGGATNCRGANDAAEFARQWPKTVANLVNGGADVIGIMEIENDGYGASSAIQDLVNQLNSRHRAQEPMPSSTSDAADQPDQRPGHRRHQGRPDLQAGQGDARGPRRPRSTATGVRQRRRQRGRATGRRWPRPLPGDQQRASASSWPSTI